jgi:hypothetical protein
MIYEPGQRFLYMEPDYQFIAEIISVDKINFELHFTCKVLQVIGVWCPWVVNQVKSTFDPSDYIRWLYLKGQDSPGE